MNAWQVDIHWSECCCAVIPKVFAASPLALHQKYRVAGAENALSFEVQRSGAVADACGALNECGS